MAHPTHSLAHVHLTKKQTTRVVDMSAYVIGVGGNIAVIPQIIKAWQSDSPGLAVLTWILFSFFGIIWLIYAILHKQRPLIVAQIVSLFCNVAVVAGWAYNQLS